MVKPYWTILPAFHSYDKMVPLQHPVVKACYPRASPSYLSPLAYLATGVREGGVP